MKLSRAVFLSLSLALPCMLAAVPALAGAPATQAAPAKPPRSERAIFAGGCFWCEETTFEGLPGVLSVVSGYTGGKAVNPTYEAVSAGGTGHAESVEITYDPAKVTYQRLLDVYWHNIDPTQANGQFCDHGTQYRSAIFYLDDAQKKAALASNRKLETTPQRWRGRIVTEIVPAGKFHPAEEYHQDFWKKSPERYFSYREGCGRDARLKELWGPPERDLLHRH